VNHHLRVATGWVLDACDAADRHTGGALALVALALAMAGAAWVLLHGFACWCGKCEPAEPAPLPVRPVVTAASEPDLYDPRCGTDDALLAQCRAIFKPPSRREERR
jgi:hypothetical protein